MFTARGDRAVRQSDLLPLLTQAHCGKAGLWGSLTISPTARDTLRSMPSTLPSKGIKFFFSFYLRHEFPRKPGEGVSLAAG